MVTQDQDQNSYVGKRKKKKNLKRLMWTSDITILRIENYKEKMINRSLSKRS